jgi:hypothetical protein
MFELRQAIWWASCDSIEVTENCPDCFGKKYLTVILGDDSEVKIDCRTCALGYEPPRGYITLHKYGATARPGEWWMAN